MNKTTTKPSVRFTARLVALAALAALALDPRHEGAALAAPAHVPNEPLDLELRQADVRNVFRMLADVSGRAVTLDPCVHGTVDLRLVNTPLPLVYDALALKLGLVYEERGERGVVVGCARDGGSPSAPGRVEPRVSLSVRGVALTEVVAHLGSSAKLAVDYRASTRPNVTMTLENVRLSTALTALSDATGFRVAIEGDKVVVSDK